MEKKSLFGKLKDYAKDKANDAVNYSKQKIKEKATEIYENSKEEMAKRVNPKKEEFLSSIKQKATEFKDNNPNIIATAKVAQKSLPYVAVGVSMFAGKYVLGGALLADVAYKQYQTRILKNPNPKPIVEDLTNKGINKLGQKLGWSEERTEKFAKWGSKAFDITSKVGMAGITNVDGQELNETINKVVQEEFSKSFNEAFEEVDVVEKTEENREVLEEMTNKEYVTNLYGDYINEDLKQILEESNLNMAQRAELASMIKEFPNLSMGLSETDIKAFDAFTPEQFEDFKNSVNASAAVNGGEFPGFNAGGDSILKPGDIVYYGVEDVWQANQNIRTFANMMEFGDNYDSTKFLTILQNSGVDLNTTINEMNVNNGFVTITNEAGETFELGMESDIKKELTRGEIIEDYAEVINSEAMQNQAKVSFEQRQLIEEMTGKNIHLLTEEELDNAMNEIIDNQIKDAVTNGRYDGIPNEDFTSVYYGETLADEIAMGATAHMTVKEEKNKDIKNENEEVQTPQEPIKVTKAIRDEITTGITKLATGVKDGTIKKDLAQKANTVKETSKGVFAELKSLFGFGQSQTNTNTKSTSASMVNKNTQTM